MAEEPNARAAHRQGWQAGQLAVMCALCMAAGFLAGYLLRGSAPVAAPAVSAQAEGTAPSAQTTGEPAGRLQTQETSKPMPTLDDLKRMADMKAAPLLAKSKSDQKNPELLNQIGLIYENAHQFNAAAAYFEKSLQYDPKNIGVRADYASCLYYAG